MYNILTESGISMKLVRLIKMNLNETYSRVQVGKHLSDFSYQKLFETRRCCIATAFQLCLEYPIRRIQVQVNQDDLELNGIHQLLVYIDVNILGGSIQTIKKNTEALIARKKIGLEVNADKTKYVVMSQDQNAG